MCVLKGKWKGVGSWIGRMREKMMMINKLLSRWFYFNPKQYFLTSLMVLRKGSSCILWWQGFKNVRILNPYEFISWPFWIVGVTTVSCSEPVLWQECWTHALSLGLQVPLLHKGDLWAMDFGRNFCRDSDVADSTHKVCSREDSSFSPHCAIYLFTPGPWIRD